MAAKTGANLLDSCFYGSCPKSVIAHKRFCSKELWSGGLRSCSRKIGKRAVPEHRELCELSVAGRVAVRAVFNRWVTGGSSGRSCHPAAECPKTLLRRKARRPGRHSALPPAQTPGPKDVHENHTGSQLRGSTGAQAPLHFSDRNPF